MKRSRSDWNVFRFCICTASLNSEYTWSWSREARTGQGDLRPKPPDSICSQRVRINTNQKPPLGPISFLHLFLPLYCLSNWWFWASGSSIIFNLPTWSTSSRCSLQPPPPGWPETRDSTRPSISCTLLLHVTRRHWSVPVGLVLTPCLSTQELDVLEQHDNPVQQVPSGHGRIP